MCVCVCAWVSVYVFVFVWDIERACVNVSLCLWNCVCLSLCECCVCTFVFVFVCVTYIRMWVRVCVFLYSYLCVFASVFNPMERFPDINPYPSCNHWPVTPLQFSFNRPFLTLTPKEDNFNQSLFFTSLLGQTGNISYLLVPFWKLSFVHGAKFEKYCKN